LRVEGVLPASWVILPYLRARRKGSRRSHAAGGDCLQLDGLFKLFQYAGKFGIAATGLELAEDFFERSFVAVRQAGKFVVGNQVFPLGFVAGVVLIFYGDFFELPESRGEDGAVAFGDVTAAVGDDDRAAPAVLAENLEVKAKLLWRVLVRIVGVRLQVRRPGKLVVRGVDPDPVG
jgi:hypothetical protein